MASRNPKLDAHIEERRLARVALRAAEVGRGRPGGVAELDATGKVPVAQLGEGGVPNDTTFLRGDRRWATVVGATEHGNELHNPDFATEEALNAHTGAAAPHPGHETPAGAQAKVDSHAAAAGAHPDSHAEQHTLSSHTTRAHNELTGIGPADHHDNKNDPSAGQKAALEGTSGVPGSANRYVTDSDPRNSDARVPLAHNQAAETITTGVLDGDRLPPTSTTKRGAVAPTGTPSNKFYRDDGTWASPDTAAVNIKEVEVNWGSGLHQKQKVVNVVDSDVTTTSQLLVVAAYRAATGKSLDECEMDSFVFRPRANAGSFDLLMTSLEGSFTGGLVINYLVG